MELYINRDALAGALANAAQSVEKRTTQPITDAVLLEAGERLTVTRFDGNAAYVEAVEANVETQGSIAIDAGTLLRTVRALPDATVHVRLAGDLLVTSGRAEFKLRAIDASEFPAPPALEPDGVTVEAADLAVALERVAACVATEDVLWGINGAHVENVDGGVRLVATDRHRLAWSEVEASGPLAMPARTLIPHGMLHRLGKVLDTGPVTVAVSDGAAEVRGDGWRLWFRLLDGEFPDYRVVIPTEHKIEAEARCGGLAASLRRVAIVAEKNTASTMAVDTGGVGLAHRSERGSVAEDVPGEADGEIEIGINAGYLADVLRVMGGETCRLRFTHELAPVLVDTPDEDGVGFVIMPMRLD